MDDRTYKIYDKIVAFLITDLAASANESNIISFSNFNPESKEHLLVFVTALYAASLYGRTVALNLNDWDYLKFRKRHKTLKKFYTNHETITTVNLPTEVGKVFMEVPEAKELTTLGVIYDEYYAPEKNRKGK